MILGHSWLLHHNLEVDWVTWKVQMTRCLSECGRKSTPEAQQSDMEPGDTICIAFLSSEGEEYIHATTTPSQQMAKEALADEGGRQEPLFEKIVPESYH